MSYSDPIHQSYTALNDAAVSSAADVFSIVGPKGKKGKVVGLSVVTKVATTVAVDALELGTQADPDAIGSFAIPITAINLAIQPTYAQLKAFAELAADTVYVLSGGGLATAGNLDITLTVAWY